MMMMGGTPEGEGRARVTIGMRRRRAEGWKEEGGGKMVEVRVPGHWPSRVRVGGSGELGGWGGVESTCASKYWVRKEGTAQVGRWVGGRNPAKPNSSKHASLHPPLPLRHRGVEQEEPHKAERKGKG